MPELLIHTKVLFIIIIVTINNKNNKNKNNNDDINNNNICMDNINDIIFVYTKVFFFCNCPSEFTSRLLIHLTLEWTN